jgi:hypothetical protein
MLLKRYFTLRSHILYIYRCNAFCGQRNMLVFLDDKMLSQSKNELHKLGRDTVWLFTQGSQTLQAWMEPRLFLCSLRLLLFLVEWKCLGPISRLVADLLSTGTVSAIIVLCAVVTPFITLLIDLCDRQDGCRKLEPSQALWWTIRQGHQLPPPPCLPCQAMALTMLRSL